jgi:hypothetical protein
MKKQNLRSMAAKAVEQVIEQGQSLSNILLDNLLNGFGRHTA